VNKNNQVESSLSRRVTSSLFKTPDVLLI